MKYLFTFFTILLIQMICQVSAYAVLPSFDLKDQNAKGVFVDFKTANYEINYDLPLSRTTVVSQIEFTANEVGYPVVDLVTAPSKVILNGKEVQTIEVMPQGFHDKIRVITSNVQIGQNQLVVEHIMQTTYLKMENGEVSNRFDFSDYGTERGFLEQYLPANFEYDQVAMSFKVQILGNAADHRVITNGNLRKVGSQAWEIKFKEYYNSSSLWYHIVPISKITQLQEYVHTFSNGEKMPVTIYSVSPGHTLDQIKQFVDGSKSQLTTLEKRFGRFPHDQLIILMGSAFGGGMEYAGATITSYNALYHELAHSYFGRAVLSKNGESAWIDEALASFVSRNPGSYYFANGPTNLTRMSQYKRTMLDQSPYTIGQAVIHEIKKSYQEKGLGEFDNCLKTFFENRKYVAVTTQVFKADIEGCLKENLTTLFNRHVYGLSADLTLRQQKNLPVFFNYNKRFTDF